MLIVRFVGRVRSRIFDESALSNATIDLSRLPPPKVIENIDYEIMLAETLADFSARYPQFSAFVESEPALKVAEAFAYREMLWRIRLNDAARAVLAPLAAGADLDIVVARQGLHRLVLVPANPIGNIPATMETDAQLLRRYLLSFERHSAGSAARYLFEVFTALPSAGDAAVIGHKVHGRRGDTDVVVSGKNGRNVTDAELAAIRARVLADDVAPDAVAVAVLRAHRVEYQVELVVEVPRGPDGSLIAADAAARLKVATDERTRINAEVPLDFLTGAAYGPNVIAVRRLKPTAAIEPDPYSVPVCTSIDLRSEVRA